MAKNWTMAEAAKAVKTNDMVAIADLGKRFPLMMNLLTRGIAGDGDAVAELFEAIPEYLTANKVNTAIKNVVDDGEIEDDEEEDAVEEPKKKEQVKKSAEVTEDDEDEDTDDDYESMTGNQLVALCKERGIWSSLKDKKKAGMIAGLRAADANGDDDEDEEEADDGDYSEMSPQELFKECKKRGLKPEVKKPAKYYIAMLEKDDAANEDADDEDWEDEEEEETQKKPAKKADKKPAKKPAKKEVEEDEEDDEDWDI